MDENVLLIQIAKLLDETEKRLEKNFETKLKEYIKESLKEQEDRMKKYMSEGFNEVVEILGQKVEDVKNQVSVLEKRVIDLDHSIRYVNNTVGNLQLDVHVLKQKVQ